LNNIKEKNEKINDKKAFLIVAIVFILLIIAGGAYFFYLRSRNQATNDAYLDANKVTISSVIMGRIAKLYVNENDRVTKGEIIAKIDDSLFRKEELQAELNMEYAYENVRMARISLNKAKLDMERAEIQFKNKIIPKEQYDNYKKALEIAETKYNEALLQAKISETRLQIARNRLSDAIIKSPITGIIAKKWLLEGDVVQPAQPIYTVYDLDHIWVTANFKETQIKDIHPNDSATISIDAYPNLKYQGKIISIGSATASLFSLIPQNNASGNFTKVTQRVPVKISIINPLSQKGINSIRLLPGMSVSVKVKLNSNKK